MPDLDWDSLARSIPVLVFYMALKNLDRISARLIEAGAKPETPAAIISKATTDAQEVIETTLGGCARDARHHRGAPPAVIVVGDVVYLRHALDWFCPARTDEGDDEARLVG